MSGADRTRGRKAMTGFTPVRHSDTGAARDYLEGVDTPATPAVKGYLDGGWRDTNTALRAGKTPDGVDELDEAMRPLPDDVMLRRQVPLSLFGDVPVKDLEGRKVRDAAPASTSLDVPGQDAGGAGVVTMHIAAPKGTPALVNAADGEILLARDTEVAITRVEPDGDGGWDVYGAVLPTVGVKSGGKSGEKPADPDTEQPEGGDKVRADLMKLKVPELQAQMRERGLKPGRLRKSQLVDALVADETGGEPDGGSPPGPTGPAAEPAVTPKNTAKPKAATALDAAPISLVKRGDTTLTQPQRDALNGYKRTSYLTINAELRRGDASSDRVARIDEVMAASKLTADVQVFRGMNSARRMFGDRVNGDLTGMSWREDAYVSSTARKATGTQFANAGSDRNGGLLMQITAPQDTGAVTMSKGGYESELLLDRGHEFTVTKDHGLVDGVRVVDVQVRPKIRPADTGTDERASTSDTYRVMAADRLDQLASTVNTDTAGFEARTAQAKSSPIDLHLQQVGTEQGFDATPRVGTREELDAAVADGWTETWRGVMSNESGITAAQINEQLRTGTYEPGRGYYGNGYYVGERRLTAENFRGSEPRTNQPAGGGDDFELSDLEPVDDPDSLLRIAIDPAAKTADFDDLVAEQKAWMAGQPAGSPAAKVFADVGRFAAARGVDVISVSGDHPDGGYYPGWEDAWDELAGAVQYVVLNRSVMLVQRSEDAP